MHKKTKGLLRNSYSPGLFLRLVMLFAVVASGLAAGAQTPQTITSRPAYTGDVTAAQFIADVPGGVTRKVSGVTILNTLLADTNSVLATRTWVLNNVASGTGTGGAVPSVFGRTGAVTALSSDYSAFYGTLSAQTTNTANITTIFSYYNGSVIKPTSLPIGSPSALGAYKVGLGLAVAGDGTLSATGAGAGSGVIQNYLTGFNSWGTLVGDSIKVASSYTAGPGTVSASDNVKTATQKLDGNIQANTSFIASNTSSIGTLSSLTTTAKGNLVAAINEVNAKPSGSGAVDSFYLSNRDFAGAGTVANPYTIVKSYSISSATDSAAASSLAVFNGLLTKVDSIRNVSGALAFLKNGTWNSFGTVPIANSQLTNDVGFVTGMQYLQNGTLINSTPRGKLNLIPGSNVASILVVDNPGQGRVDLTINAALGGSGSGVTTDNVPHNYVTGYNTDGTLEADSVTIGAAYTAGTSYGAVTTSDNVLTALQKLDGNWSSSLGTGSIKSAKAMGVSVIAQTDGVDISATQTAQGMSAQVMIFSSIYLDKPATITGVWISPTTTGSFTGNLENSISLYSYSGGVLTRVATTANDPTIFQKTGSVIVQIPFASTYSAAAGQYFVGALMNSTGTVTTQPFLSAMAGKTYASTWLGKNYFQITGMTASPSTVTLASQTGLSTIGTKTWFALY